MAMRKAGDYLAEFAQGTSNQYQPRTKYRSDGSGDGTSMPTPSKQSIAASYVGADNNYGTGEETKENNLRMMKHSAANAVNQEKYKTTSSGIAQRAIEQADKNRYINTEALDNRINEREMYNRAQGTVAFSDIFGDMWAQKAPGWNSADPSKDVEAPDFEKMYDKYNPMDD